MDEIRLLYAKNLITRKTSVVRQVLSFVALVQNISYQKLIDIVWAGEDGVWQTLPAVFHSSIDHDKEYWFAQTESALTADGSLPGNIHFGLRYRASGVEYWDKNDGENYSIQADTGIAVWKSFSVLNTGFERQLAENEKFLPVEVTVGKNLGEDKVVVHWTSNNWRTIQQSPCHFAPTYWDTEYRSNARNPNHYGCKVWNGQIKVSDSFRIRYRISCETRQRVIWDDNFGQGYSVEHRPLRVLILNLHCYQEDNQDFKLSQIAKAIEQQDVDIVCLQEVAELWNDGKGDWKSNTARIINERLVSPYHLVTDWSHQGFSRYREGVAILSRYPILKHEGRYISSSHDPFSIHSRKVIMAQVRVPYCGLINVFSSHLSWWDDGFPEQFNNLRQWAAREHTHSVSATMLCGDFNIEAGSDGYQHVLDSREYDDQYLAVNSPHISQAIAKLGDALGDSSWRRDLEGDSRIDYVFLRRGGGLCATKGKVLFTDQDYGTVSDHFGYLMTFEPRE